MIIEQSLMKSIKTDGGVARGRSTQESVLSKWIYGMYTTNAICEGTKNFAVFHWTLQISMLMREILVLNEMMLMLKK